MSCIDSEIDRVHHHEDEQDIVAVGRGNGWRAGAGHHLSLPACTGACVPSGRICSNLKCSRVLRQAAAQCEEHGGSDGERQHPALADR